MFIDSPPTRERRKALGNDGGGGKEGEGEVLGASRNQRKVARPQRRENFLGDVKVCGAAVDGCGYRRISMNALEVNELEARSGSSFSAPWQLGVSALKDDHRIVC
jgi:hypothetical protein